MAAIYSISVAHGLRAGSTNAVVYTVPTGSVLVLRSVWLAMYAGGPGGAGVTHSDGSRACGFDPSGATGEQGFDLREVFDAGEVVYVYTTAGDWTYALSGYLLDA